MTIQEMNAEIARHTGEDLRTITKRGFSPLKLTDIPHDEVDDREPLVVDWDELELERVISLAG